MVPRARTVRTLSNDKFVRLKSARKKYMPTLGALLALSAMAAATSSCGDSCGIFENYNECVQEQFDDRTAIDLSMAFSARTFDLEDGMIVSVIARNRSKNNATIATQVCNRPFYVYTADNVPVAEPVTICNGESYAGAQLAPGDSIVWSGDIRDEIKNGGKDLPAGTYLIKARLRFGNAVVWTKPDSVTITRKSF